MQSSVDAAVPSATSLHLFEAVILAQTEIAAALPDADAVMRLVVRHAMALTGATGASIAFREGDEVVFPVNEGFTARWERSRFPLTETLTGLCLQTEEPLILDDLDASSHLQSAVARRAGIRSFLAIPLRHGGRVVAALSVASPQPQAFSEETILALLLLVGLAGSALAHAEAFAELRLAKDDAERARAEAADFSRMVAHELGSPIAAIWHSAELLTTGPLDELQARAHFLIEAEVKALTLLVSDLQAAASMERDSFDVRPREVAVGQLLAEAKTVAETLPGRHPITVESDGDWQVTADPDRIRQVLRNLLGNAAKYTPPQTPITLRATREADRVRIDVIDQGPGIEPDDLQHIFTRFGRGRGANTRGVAGLGLGLYLSSRIVFAHGGELSVDSTLGHGSTFTFSLPVAPGQ